MNRQYPNTHWDKDENVLKAENAEQARIIRSYQKHYAYLLAQPWYIERLPEIRKHYETLISSKTN